MTVDIHELPRGTFGVTTAAREPRPKYLFEIWLLTGIYLTFELAFNARLIANVAGDIGRGR